MALINTFAITKTEILMDDFLKATHNEYRVVSSRNYSDKKGKLPDGMILTLMVLHDDMDYGIDKNGEKRESNVFQNFDVTVFSRHPVKKGDYIQLIDFVPDNSFVIKYDLVLRFNDFKVITQEEATA